MLKRLFELYESIGFPPVSSVQVLSRTATPCGRYVDLDTDAELKIQEGYLDLGGQFIQMEGIPNGMMVVARIESHRLKELEFTTYGGDAWDGEERTWTFS